MISTASKTNPGIPLSQLFAGMDDIGINANPTISSLHLDSREVEPGGLFFAIPGSSLDGRNYIPQAIRSGASAVAYDPLNWMAIDNTSVPSIEVPRLQRRIGKIADVFYNHPSSKLHVVGITGTNGKTTCAWLVAQALDELGSCCGLLGTLGSGLMSKIQSESLTTPNAIQLQKRLSDLLDAGAEFACMEVSSHALDQSRTSGTRFQTVVFTNLSQDHLDYHGTFANYRNAKARLFEEEHSSCSILNIDDEFGKWLVDRARTDKVVTYGQGKSDIQLLNIESSLQGLQILLSIEDEVFQIQSKLLGRINAINLTAVAAVLHSLGHTAERIAQALETLNPVSGRLEQLAGMKNKPRVFIDFAHTPDGLKLVLDSLKELTEGNLWCVFGCGGDRDKIKRAAMGAVAESKADKVVLCDDNPRTEDPKAILTDILEGMTTTPVVQHDRYKAIRFAITKASPDDIVLVAGKGHEQTQIFADRTIEFNDRAVVEEILGQVQ